MNKDSIGNYAQINDLTHYNISTSPALATIVIPFLDTPCLVY